MTTIEVIQFACILALLAASYWWFWTWGDREQRNALIKMESAEYPVALTGSMFVPSFDPYVTKEGTVYLPVTDGLYPTRITPKKRGNYLGGLRGWLQRGAKIEMFVTRPEPRCVDEWASLVDEFPDRFRLHLLDRNQVAGPDAEKIKSQIERLDTFHPVILVDSSDVARPGVMWIEGHHPVGSKYAYNVKFSKPADTATDDRFPKYKEMYAALLKGPHVKTIQPTKH